MQNKLIIAEVKTKSPFGFVSEHSKLALYDRAFEVGDMISVHTDPRWGGSFQELVTVRRAMDKAGHRNKPILAKGLHLTLADIENALDHGANKVLVVGWYPHTLLDHVYIEVTSGAQIKEFLALAAASNKVIRLVHNSRDLRTGKISKFGFEDAKRLCPRNQFLVQASNIRRVSDIHPEADAVLIGEALMNFRRMDDTILSI